MTSSNLFITLALFFLVGVATSTVIDPSERLSFGIFKDTKCGFLKRCSKNKVCAGKGWFKKRCVVPMKLGGRCGQDPYWVCASRLTCSAGRCVKFMGPGGTCTDPFWKCKSGLFCNAHKVCTAPKVVHYKERCSLPSIICEPNEGLGCVGNGKNDFCLKLMDEGKSCIDPWWVCKSGLVCTAEGHRKICRRPKH